MGTSSSSKGPGSNVPFVPSWVPPLPTPLPPPDDEDPAAPEDALPAPVDPLEPEATPTADNAQTNPQPPEAPSVDLGEQAPPRRFAAARTSLGQFASTGDRASLQRGLGHYVATGMGGARTATHRMAGTAVNAGALHGVLESLRTKSAPPAGIDIDPQALAGRPAREVADRIALALQRADGTQDAEASRDAIARAFSELITAEPDVDILALTPEQVEFVTMTYVAEDICHHVELDVGNAIRDKAQTVALAVERLEELKAYVRQEVARCFRTRADKGQTLSRQNAASLVAGVIRSTFDVFEEYI